MKHELQEIVAVVNNKSDKFIKYWFNAEDDDPRNPHAFLLHRLNASRRAPTGYDVLKMATRGSARLLGRDDIGQLAVGKCADLFMIDSRRLELVGSCFDPKSVLGTVGVRGPVDYTVVHGRVTVAQGHLMTVDEERLAQDAETCCRQYLAR